MSEQISVLVIEDEEHIRNILEYNLRSDGFDVYLAEHGLRGVELAREKRPDVILLDWVMPKMDGLEVLSELKRDRRTKRIPVFMLTVKDDEDDVRRALNEGADWYFTKPFGDATELGQQIKSMLEPLMESRKRYLPFM